MSCFLCLGVVCYVLLFFFNWQQWTVLKAASLKPEVALIDSELFLMFGSCFLCFLLFFNWEQWTVLKAASLKPEVVTLIDSELFVMSGVFFILGMVLKAAFSQTRGCFYRQWFLLGLVFVLFLLGRVLKATQVICCFLLLLTYWEQCWKLPVLSN